MEGPVTEGAPETVGATEGASDGEGVPSGKVETLPPPEWTGPAAAPRTRMSHAPPALARRSGRRAEEAHLRARLAEARAEKDEARERGASVELARWLAGHDRELDEAVDLALRALGGADDGGALDELRRELAAWLESLGEPGLAAAELRKLADMRRADAVGASAILVRVGVLHARAGDAVGASEAFAEAAKLAPDNALAMELLGTLAAWAPEVVTPEAAAAAYAEAAARRAAAGGQGAKDAALEDLARAFEADATHEPAARALAAALDERGKARAADEVWRAHARAIGKSAPERARLVHAKRRIDAVKADDAARALGAALDEGLDRVVEGEDAAKLDEILLRAGLFEPLAERLEARADRASGAARAKLREELARLYEGPLASPSRAAGAHTGALAAEPGHAAATAALEAYASESRDPTPLVEGLVRAAQADDDGDAARREGRVASARKLAMVAEEIGEPGVAMWAHEKVLELAPDDAEARAGVKRAGPPMNARYAELVRARNELASSAAATRIEALRKIAAVMRGMPGEADILSEVLAELARYEPRYALDAARLAARRGDVEEAARLARERVGEPDLTPEQRVEARLLLAAAARATGGVAEANDASRPLLELAPESREAASAAWMNAALAGDAATRARAIARLGDACAPELAAAMRAFASEQLAFAGEPDEARREAERAVEADPHAPRALAALADAVCRDAEGGRRPVDRAGVAAIERAVTALAATSAWCEAIARALEELGDFDYAVAWTQRLVALRPGDRAKVQLLFERLARADGAARGTARAAARLGDALAWALSQPQPGRELGALVAAALGSLADIDADRAVVIARRALDVLGPRQPELRAAMAHVAERARDDEFGAALLERWLAAGAPAAERKELFVALADRRARAGDRDGEARALARAMREGVGAEDLAARIIALTPPPPPAPGAPGSAPASDAAHGPSGDGELTWLDMRAELLVARGDAYAAARALRELGGAAWDLAGDRPRALRAWVRAAKLQPARGYMTLGLDVARFAGGPYALDVLADLVGRESDPARGGIIATEAARVALSLGENARAFELARAALGKNPALGEALEIAERGAALTDRAPEMSGVYDALARRSLGRFGRRAAHYRGARFFENRARLDLALKHAAEAFTAVPSEGNTLQLLARTADRAGTRGVAVRALEQVAELASTPRARAAWLLRAAGIAGGGGEGARQRFDVLLRAVVLSPDNATLAYLAEATKELLQIAPDEKDLVQMRLTRATEALSKKVDGPEGARVALAFAELSLDLFGDADAALGALERALAADGDLEEFARLVPRASLLARAGDAPESLRRAMAAAQKPYANVGVAALKVLGALAGALGDADSRAKALVMAVEKDQDDDALVSAADEALSTCSDAELAARFAKKVPDARRAESLRARAEEERPASAQGDAAVEALARAVVAEGDQARARVEGEHEEAPEVVAFGPETERRLLREAKDETLTPIARADKWAEIAHGREELGDLAGAAEALETATEVDPELTGRWSELERVAELAGRADLRVAALRRLVDRVGGEEQAAAPTMKRLARALEAAGEAGEAESVWRRIWKLAPNDEEVDYALEALITARGDYEELAERLAARAERLAASPLTRDALRPVRLRRAAILEQRLDRAALAQEELERLLAEWPDNESALCYLADLYERTGQPARAVPLWLRVAGLARDPERHAELSLRAARACVAAGELDQAIDKVRAVLAERPTDGDALALRVEIARHLQSTRELGDALTDLATASAEDATARSDMLVEAAQAAARAGDMGAALERAQRAAYIAPQRAKTQLFARGLEYRVRGAGAPDEARATIEALERIQDALDVEDAALMTFLYAEALDVIQGGGAGLRKLSERYAEIGAHPLVAVAMAERLVAQWNFATAVPLFDAALKGNLLGLRRRGALALAAAQAASRAERPDDALRFLDDAAADPETRTAALKCIAQIASVGGDVARSRKALAELARGQEGVERAQTLAKLGRALFTSQEPEDRDEAARAFVEAMDAAAPDRALVAQLEEELRELRKRQSVSPQALMTSVPPPDLAPEDEREAAADATPDATPTAVEPARPALVSIHDLEAAVESAPDPGERASLRVQLAAAKIDEGQTADAEKLLWQSFAEGSREAGELLARQLEAEQGRAADLVRVRRQLLDLQPGDAGRLEALIAAAYADHNSVYARALEHVLRAFDPGAGPLPPPPLAAQIEQPRVLQLLARHSHEPTGEAIALVWEGATTAFARTPASYALTGLERVVPGASSTIARLYEIAVRLLDAPRIPLFLRKSSAAPSAMVALLQPPSAILSGDAREDSPALRFALGQALSAALPQNALVLGLGEQEARAMWHAMLGAFGPPELGRELDAQSAKLAETFWQLLPARTQRRLKELLAGEPQTRFELLAERARQSGRRVGLFLTGDFAFSARALVREQRGRAEDLAAPGGVAALCASMPQLADLYRLAVRPEYADARWRPEAPLSRRMPSGKTRVL